MRKSMCAAEIKYRLATEANMTLTKFAKEIGRDPSTVSMVIHGRRKSKPIMDAISEVLATANFNRNNSGESK